LVLVGLQYWGWNTNPKIFWKKLQGRKSSRMGRKIREKSDNSNSERSSKTKKPKKGMSRKEWRMGRRHWKKNGEGMGGIGVKKLDSKKKCRILYEGAEEIKWVGGTKRPKTQYGVPWGFGNEPKSMRR